MTETEALERAWSFVRDNDLGPEIVGLQSIHLSTAVERREVLEDDDPDLADTWYVRFLLKLDEGVIGQDPDNILIAVDDRSGEAILHYQM